MSVWERESKRLVPHDANEPVLAQTIRLYADGSIALEWVISERPVLHCIQPL